MDGQGKGSLVMLLAMSSLLLGGAGASQSNYTNATGPGTPLPLQLDRAIVFSHYIYTLSTELNQEFETIHSEDVDFFGLYITNCHTASLLMPQNTEQALKIQPKDVVILLIRLLRSWHDPLRHLMVRAVCLTNITMSFLEKIEEVHGNIKYQIEDLERIARQLAPEIKDYGDPAVWTELSSLKSTDRKQRLHAFYYLCRCLSKDTHKAETFLRLLKSYLFSQVVKDSNY